MAARGAGVLAGEEAFRLKDTDGFPLDAALESQRGPATRVQ